ncbi:hypothetical protein NUACC21_33320 [Scytonema sp. NUACC21]
MQPIRTFNVSPSLPQRLEPLRKLAYNLHWDWNVETKDLFRRLDPDLWESSRHNPVLMLGTISQARLMEVVEDEGFLAQMDRAARQLEDYWHERTWYQKQRKQDEGLRIKDEVEKETSSSVHPSSLKLHTSKAITVIEKIFDFHTLGKLQSTLSNSFKRTFATDFF